MNKATLVVMAAGMGSRFGGLKQMEPITDDGRCLLDFSAYDAKQAGFDKTVFIVRKDIEADFKRLVGNRIAGKTVVDYVIQDTDGLPEGRTKPFGTAHAVLCCKDVVSTPFVVINADDYYGANPYVDLYNHLNRAKQGQYAMVAYKLGNTVSKNGLVTRGICRIDGGYLSKIVETAGIDGSCASASGKVFDVDTPVSMNMWALTTDVFGYLEKKFAEFKQTADLSTQEFLLPNVIADAISDNVASVKAYESSDKWYGVTFREDLSVVKRALRQMIEQGKYGGI